MSIKTESTSRNLGRSIGMAVLLSTVFFYAIHVLGTWQIENYRPDMDTTSTVLLHNKCAILGDTHTLRPNTDVSAMGDSIDRTKLTAGFMNFFDGHIAAMLFFSLLMTGLIFILRRKIQYNRNDS